MSSNIRATPLNRFDVRPARPIKTVYPYCPACGRPMRLLCGADDWSTNPQPGQPHVWWCPDDATVLQRRRGRWFRQIITEEGDLVTVEEVSHVETLS